MSEELFYDRTRNISGVSLLNGTEYIPIYGSSVSFSSNNMEFKTNDGYYQLSPRGINNLGAKFNLKYKTDENAAQKLANYYENSEGHKQVIVRTDPQIYNDVSGYCDQYSINRINNQHYEVGAMLEVLESPGFLNWSGMNYLNPDFEDWQNGQSYNKDDIVYTGVNNAKINNFFYCTSAHSSDPENSPTGANSNWTQDFSWNPDIGSNNTVQFDVTRYEGGYSTMNKIKDNTAVTPITYNFNSITTKQLKSMLHFLENKGGYRRFKHQISSIYNRPKVFICPEWTHTWVYNNSHNLTVSFKEDPLGVIPKNS